MKHILIFIIRMYQATPLSSHQFCRHKPTCSQYMVEAIIEHGCIRGVKLGIIRISKCRPGGTFGFDPVPKKEGNK